MSVILCDIDDLDEVISEEKQAWLQRVLIALGAEEAEIAQNTYEAKEHLTRLGLDVWRHHDGSIEILRPEYIQVPIEMTDDETGEPMTMTHRLESRQKKVAEWLPPEVVRIREGRRNDHYRITLREWALPFQMGE